MATTSQYSAVESPNALGLVLYVTGHFHGLSSHALDQNSPTWCLEAVQTLDSEHRSTQVQAPTELRQPCNPTEPQFPHLQNEGKTSQGFWEY